MGLKARALKKASEKISKSMGNMVAFAINNDQAYEGLMDTVRSINEGRKAKRKYYYSLSTQS